jgi:hypothetical protein
VRVIVAEQPPVVPQERAAEGERGLVVVGEADQLPPDPEGVGVVWPATRSWTAQQRLDHRPRPVWRFTSVNHRTRRPDTRLNRLPDNP